ncbi:MAG: hypothetical protein ABI402_05420 [Ferruginibacter sp.]
MRIKYFVPNVISIIFTGLPFFTAAQGVNINGGIQLVAKGPIQLVVDNGALKNDGVFTADSSTVIFDGGTNAAVITGSIPVTFFNLIFRGTGTKSNNNDASVIATLGVSGTTVFDADGVSNDKPFILKSSDSATANVDILTTGNIIGNATVERFINTGSNPGQHAKSWQFLATPTTGQTYFQSWQEGGATPTGFGTWVTGTGTGFDATAVLPSLKYYDPPTNSWIGITNTGNLLQNKLGYMLFVRGDRTVNTYNGVPNNTNMRSKGVLFTPFNPPAAVPVTANLFQTFGNPYASRIEFNKVYLASTGINDVFYVWDPKLSGTYALGGYQTLSGITGYIPTAGSATTFYPAGVPSPFIESGQAVFVKGNATGGNVNFNENCKVAGNRLVNKGPAINENTFPNRQFLFTSLFTNTGLIGDGNIVAFQEGFGNGLNEFDAEKIINAGENFGIIRNEKILTVEAREPISDNDTIFYHFQNLRQQGYTLRFFPVNISTTLTAFLVDRFNNNSTVINLMDSSIFDFIITADIASADPDRFILVFKPAIIVPVIFINIAANSNNDQTNTVTWKVTNESNIKEYRIQRSANGSLFNDIGATSAEINNGSISVYNFVDAMPLPNLNFYRIKAVEYSGQILYSNIVNIRLADGQPRIAVYPNPVVDKQVKLAFFNQKKGTYLLELTNKLGQVVYRNSVYIDQNNFVEIIRLEKTIASGAYQLSILNENGMKTVRPVVIE